MKYDDFDALLDENVALRSEVERLRGALRKLHAVVTSDVPAREMLDAMHEARAALEAP